MTGSRLLPRLLQYFCVVSGLVALPGLAEATVWTVNSTADNNPSCSSSNCTLRAAMNAAGSGDTINFSFSGTSAPRTIEVGSTLPDVDADFTIDGFDCSGCGPVSENTAGASPALGLDSVLGITVIANSSSFSPILYMTHGGTIQGLNIQGSGGVGIELDQADNATITGCYIGTDLDGNSSPAGNATEGIWVNNAEGVQIGPYNLISGNLEYGINVTGQDSDDLEIIGNLIGTDVTASLDLGNGWSGIKVLGSGDKIRGLVLGGAVPGEINVISGNGGNGIRLEDDIEVGTIQGNLVGVNGASDASIPNDSAGLKLDGDSDDKVSFLTIEDNVFSGNAGQGIKADSGEQHTLYRNAVGTDPTGLVDLGNGGSGIELTADDEEDTKRIQIGDPTVPSQANLIAFNVGDGIRIRVIGSKKAKENRIGINSIYSNGGLGIDLEDSNNQGPLLPNTTTCSNDNAWGNRKLARPALTDAVLDAGVLDVSGTACDSATVDVYLSDVDPSGYGEPMTWIGTTTASAGGAWQLSISGNPVSGGDWVTAIQTDTENWPESSEAGLNVLVEACDDDGDGFNSVSCSGDDCNDEDSSIYPGAAEIPDDGIDQDCNVFDTVACLEDSDDDGWGSNLTVWSADGDCSDVGEVPQSASGDCDDTESSINPGATETPDDGVDQDCNGTDTVTCYEDSDGDGFGSSVVVLSPDGGCTTGPVSGVSTDCDDSLSTTYPGAPESCDAIDSDCDGDLVDGFRDTDGDGDPDCEDDDDDGDGDPDVTDCDDIDASIYTGATELCDGIDNNCDTVIDEGFPDNNQNGTADCAEVDDDGDGYSEGDGDCDDTDSSVNPGATEVPGDGIDQDCDGFDAVSCFADVDGDTWGDSLVLTVAAGGNCSDEGYAAQGGDCDDSESSVNPGAAEVLGDGIDQDCDGLDSVSCFVDGDGDGFGSLATLVSPDDDCDDTGESSNADDCHDGDSSVAPGAAEVCDGIDSDCDGSLVDEFGDDDGDGLPDCVDPDYDGDGDGWPAAEDCNDADASIMPGAVEVLDDGIDQDCNGSDTVSCWSDLDGDGYGGAADGFTTDNDGDGVIDDCENPELVTLGGDCDDEDDAIHPAAEEVCDGVDQDCDGQFLPGEDQDFDEDGWVECLDCNDDEPDVFPQIDDEICDGLDSNCDGVIQQWETLDADGDGVVACLDCDDEDPGAGQIYPEECTGDLDEDCDGDFDTDDTDCDGLIDADGDGWCPDGEDLDGDGDCSSPDEAFDGEAESGDCDDEDAAVHPGAEELCNGLDDDCNGLADFEETPGDDDDSAPGDDDDSALGGDSTELDLDGDGVMDCEGDCDDDDPEVYLGAAEVCADGIDQDCDYSETAGFDDPECWAPACTDCAGSYRGRGGAAPLSLLFLLGLIGCTRRSRRPSPRPLPRLFVLWGSPVALVLLMASVASANSPAAKSATDALSAGDCAGALEAAQVWVVNAPEKPAAWRTLGDVWRCLGNQRESVRAYRQHMELGPGDPGVVALIDSLAAQLAIVEVRLRGDITEQPNVTVSWEGGEERRGGAALIDGATVFLDVPSFVELKATVSGLGFGLTEATLDPVDAGGREVVELAADWQGLGSIQLARPVADDVTATFESPGLDPRPLSATDALPATLGGGTAVFASTLGTTRTDLLIGGEGVTLFHPVAALPASLKLSGVPAGSSLRVYVENSTGDATTRSLQLPASEGELDMHSGVLVAGSLSFDSLMGGTGGVFVKHPQLGSGVASVVIAAGENNIASFQWELLDGVPGLRKNWQAWNTERQRVIRETRRLPIGLGVASAGFATAAAILFGGAQVAGVGIGTAQGEGLAASTLGDNESVGKAWDRYSVASAQEQALLTASAVAGGIAVTSLGLTVAFGLKGERQRARLLPWEPWEVPPQTTTP